MINKPRDIIGKKKAVELKTNRLKLLIENAFDGIIMESTRESIYAVDEKFNYIAFNRNHSGIMKLVYRAVISIGDNALAPLKGAPEYKWLRMNLSRALKGELFVSEQHINQKKYNDRYIETTYNPISSKDKVTGVAVFVRDITERKKSEEKLRVLNNNLTQQNQILAKQEEELKIALEKLSERNFELDQLMYKTSHDLRSPLSSILGLINLARLDNNADNHSLYLSKIESRIEKLDDFISSMLNYAKVNRSEIIRKRINLRELIINSIHELEYLENFAAIKTSISITNEDTIFRSDSLWVEIILGNIISNAYKYYNSLARSYLKIEAKITQQEVEITFRDNGIGIRKEYAGRVFDMFYRATEVSEGSGLGMYIVKQALNKLNGTIKFKSIFGKGTTIKITLPNK